MVPFNLLCSRFYDVREDRNKYGYVLLILILKDVFLLGAIGCYVILAELLAVCIKAVMHRANECFCGDRFATEGNVVLLDLGDVIAHFGNIIQLFVGDVKCFDKLIGNIVEIAVLCFGCGAVFPYLSNDVAIAVVGQVLYCSVGVGHALKAVAAGGVGVGNKILRTDIYARQIAVCIVAHGVGLSVAAGDTCEIIVVVVSVAYRTVVGGSDLGGSAEIIILIGCGIAATVGDLGGLGGYRVILVLGFISARIDLQRLVVALVVVFVIIGGVGILKSGIDGAKLAVFEVGAGNGVAVKKLRTS